MLITATNEPLRLIVGSSIFLASYIVLLPLLATLTQKDVEVLIDIFKKAGLILYHLVMVLKVEGKIIRRLQQIEE
jgi:hypothetical protein